MTTIYERDFLEFSEPDVPNDIFPISTIPSQFVRILSGTIMSTPSNIRQPFIPFRREEIAAMARQTIEKYKHCGIDEIAEREGIILIRLPDPQTTKEGFCCVVESEKRHKQLKSTARPGQYVFSFAETEKVFHNAIVINPLKATNEAEVFWHEYYHIFYSPSRTGGATFYGGYSSAGVLDKQEESRANLFVACMLMPQIEKEETAFTLAEKYNASLELAKARLQLR